MISCRIQLPAGLLKALKEVSRLSKLFDQSRPQWRNAFAQEQGAFILRNRNVAVGKSWVNNVRKIAREVLAITVNIVTFNTHHLDTGNSCHSPSECTLRDFISGADHEATSSEMSHLRYRQMEDTLYAPQWTNAEEARPSR